MVDEGHRFRGHDVVLSDGEQRRLLEGQTPLNCTQDEQFRPRFFQQCYLQLTIKKFDSAVQANL